MKILFFTSDSVQYSSIFFVKVVRTLALHVTVQSILIFTFLLLNVGSILGSNSILLRRKNSSQPRSPVMSVAADFPVLKLGHPVQAKITGEKSDTYRIKLLAGQVVVITVTQQGVDLALTLTSLDGQIMGTMDSPNGAFGNEVLFFIADRNGDYNLELKPFVRDAARGQYTAAITTLRPASSLDKRGYKAYQAFAEGNELQEKGEVASMQAALKKYDEALVEFLGTSDVRGQALALYKLGETNDALSNSRDALLYFQRELPLWQALRERAAQAVILNNVGKEYDDLGQPEKAIIPLQQAIVLFQKVGDRKEEANTAGVIGRLYFKQSQYKSALDEFNYAIKIYSEFHDVGNEALIRSNIGKTYAELGSYQQALDLLESSLPQLKPLNQPDAEVRAQVAIADVHFLLGDYKEALAAYKETLKLFQKIGSKTGEAQALNNIGKVQLLAGSDQASQDSFEKALLVAQIAKSDLLSAYIITNIGLNKKRAGDSASALSEFGKARPIFQRLKNGYGEARVLNYRGKTLLAAGQPDQAVKDFLDALDLNQRIGARAAQADTLSNLMAGYKALDNPRLAILYGKQSVNIYQDVRHEAKSLSDELERSYLSEREASYRLLANILVEQGRIAEAEQVLTLLKDEEYFKYLRRDGDNKGGSVSKVSLTPDEAAAIARYTRLADRITAIGKQYGELYEESKKTEYENKTFPRRAMLERLKGELDDANVAFAKYIEELKLVFKNEDKRVAEVQSGLQAMLKDMQASRTAIVSTILGEDKLNIIVTTPDIQTAHTVSIKAVEVNKLVGDFRNAVTDPLIDPHDAGLKLYEILVKPIEKDLAGIDANTIVWSLDGTLRYAPVAALWDGQSYLAQRYANVVITLASQKNLEKMISKRELWKTLGAGTSKGYEEFAPLDGVPDELDCIVTDNLIKPVSATPKCQTGVMAGKKLLDETFTKEAFRNAVGRYSFVHIASHFNLTPGDDKNSFLLLGGGSDRKLSVSEINQSMFNGVELLTLSACNTAVGSEKSNGVEIEGFGAVAQNQGAKSVLATLWSVADSSTRDLMVRFYRSYSSNSNLSKAEALRQAQLTLMQDADLLAVPAQQRMRTSDVVLVGGVSKVNSKPFVKDPNRPFSHPFFWAPFVLIGNWR